MNRKSLHQLYAEHTGKLSDKWSSSLTEHERLFECNRDKPLRLLEIGIQNGGSLEIWSKYFSNAVALIGCDINPDCACLSFDDPRIKLVVGDANSLEVREQVLNQSSQFDILIDDGSHLSSDIIKSFALYFPRLVEGGLYIVEDLHCSYWSQFEGGLFDPYSSISFFKLLADIINYEHWGLQNARADILCEIFKKYDCEVDAESLAQVHSVEFTNSMCVIRKASGIDNGIGLRVIAGDEEMVVSGHRKLHGSPYQPDPIFDQSCNPWSANVTTHINEREVQIAIREQTNVSLCIENNELRNSIAVFETQISERDGQIANIEQRNASLSSENVALRNSISWRITAPMRLALKGARALTGKVNLIIERVSQNNLSIQILQKRSLREVLLQSGYIFYRQHLKGTPLGRVIAQQVLKSGLASIADFQIAAIYYDSQGIKVDPAVPMNASQIEVVSELPGFHFSPPLNFKFSDELTISPRINILIPSLRLKHMSGGPNTALLLAALLVEGGERVRLIACDAPAEGEEAALFPHMDALLKRPVSRARIELVDAFDRKQSIAIGANDIFLATAWWTAQMAKYAVEKTVHKTFIYLIQDFEPILHEGSTFQARALETYGMPHIPVINTQLLLEHLVATGAGCYADPQFISNALRFEPALDRNFYFPDLGKTMRPRKKVLLFYARPATARRNLFEIGVVALRQAVASGVIDKDNWEVWAMGEKIPPVALGNGVFLNPLPWLSFDDYAKRVRTADLMLSLMLSPHPSYPPLEMAASGKLVVTNSFSVKTAKRMRSFSKNIIVAEPTADSIAAALISAAGRIAVGLPSYDSSGEIDLPSNWDQSLSELVPELLQRIHALRKNTPASGVALSHGLPSLPLTAYEIYRKACLARRRSDGEYCQESGLLTFVTSAYNTDPVFLKELGHSLFSQDGGMHFEWLILDNGSTNKESSEVLEELARHSGVRLMRVEKNLGIIGGMRYLLERAHGRYILPLDSDDLIEPDCVHVLTRFIKDNDYPPLLYTDEDKLGEGHFGSPYFKSNWDPVLFMHSCYIAHLCAIDREKALDLDLYTDKGAEGCHDWDSFIRFMTKGFVPCHIPEVLYSWRIHAGSTSGNIASKSYITESHKNTLQRFLNCLDVSNIELVNSPLFNYNVDWWYRRKRDVPVSCVTLAISSAYAEGAHAPTLQPLALIHADNENGMAQLAQSIIATQHELVHLCWNGVTPDDDEWRWDAAGLMEIFADTVMVGGTLHDGEKVIDGPRIFGFGDGYDCPDKGRSLGDLGYSAMMCKARSVSAVSSGHCVVRRDFIVQFMPTLLAEKVSINMLGPWLGGLAAQAGKRVVFSPFMRAKAATVPENFAPKSARAAFLSRFWSVVTDEQFYSPRLGLDHKNAYVGVDPEENHRHLLRLQEQLLPYPKWLEMQVQQRANLYPILDNPARITLITTVYEQTDINLLDSLAASVTNQTVKTAQWIIVVHGPIPPKSISYIVSRAAERWGATVITEQSPLGIMKAMRRGLEKSEGEYIVPVDADDVLTPDAIQILTNTITKYNRPDLIYSDEDLLVDGQPVSPYLRSAFDPVLNLDSSYIWHLCAINRERAIALELYTDPAATWCHDWDSVIRVANAGGQMLHVPEVLYHWRQHSGSTTNNSQGDSRSLDSIRHILKQQILRLAEPQRFYVSEWPENRGAKELYIARKPEELPQIIWSGDLMEDVDKCDKNAILLITANGVLIESQEVFVEVARLLELHPNLGAVGGLVKDKNGLIVDGCYMVNKAGNLESPWTGKMVSHGSPYGLAQKPQSVATTGKSFAFFRVSALKQAGIWPLEINNSLSNLAMLLCGRISESNWKVAFSPLVLASASSAFCKTPTFNRLPVGVPSLVHGLNRYGISRNYKC